MSTLVRALIVTSALAQLFLTALALPEVAHAQDAQQRINSGLCTGANLQLLTIRLVIVAVLPMLQPKSTILSIP